jgi:L-threonylcarbamoyladenylate synthase
MVILRPLETGIEEAVITCRSALLRGDILAFPTETFYGLGVKYDNPESLGRLYALKNRPTDKAMPLIIGRKEQLSQVASTVSPAAELLMEAFWPGPLTLILPAKETVLHFITAGTGTVAVRVPGRSFALALAAALEFPITATSANISSRPPADCAEAVLDYFGEQIDMVIDCGKTSGSLPSTIIDATGSRPFVVRHGALPEEDVIRALQT